MDLQAPLDKTTANHNTTSDPLIKELGLDEKEMSRRKAWLEFTAADEENLKNLNPLTKKYADDVVNHLYEHFKKFDESRRFFEDPLVLKEVKDLEKNYFLSLTAGKYNSDYIRDRIKIGTEHSHNGLDIKWYLGAANFYLREVEQHIFESNKDDIDRAREIYNSITKLIFLDIGLAIDTYIHQREITIKKQQEAIRELSTPVLQLREGLLILPIIGAVEPVRARQLTEQLLYAIRDKRAKVVVVDITGVPTVDSRVANHIVQAVDAARLMGAKSIITGLSAEVAQTLVAIGVDLSKIHTVGDLQGGIEEAENLLGYYTKQNKRSKLPETTNKE